MASAVASTSSLRDDQKSTLTGSSSPSRVDTQLLKTQLASVLGDNGRRYWAALLDFCTAKINRQEFHTVAEYSLHPDHRILYNASSDVPGPSSPSFDSAATAKSKRGGRLSNGNQSASSAADSEEYSNGEPSRKRLRHLVAGLTNNERARLKNIGQPIRAGLGSQSSSQGSITNFGWAGAGADLLGKKRREEEKRKALEDKRKVRELMTDVGSKDWRSSATQAEAHLCSLKDRLPKATQQAISRGMVAPLCSESKELPDLQTLRDRMSIQAAELGLTNGVNPQAAAMLLSALQAHVQNVAGSVIEKIRSNRRTGIRTSCEPFTPAYLNSVSTHRELSGLSYDSPMGRNSELGDNSFSSRPTDTSTWSHSSRASPYSLRTIPSDLSTRTGASSVSGSLGVSFLGDSSMASTNTHGTSFINGTSLDGENGPDEDVENVNVQDQRLHHQSNHKPNAHQLDSSEPASLRAGQSNDLTISDMAFLLSLCPTSIVEPVGASNAERLLLPDWSEESEDEMTAPKDSSLAKAVRSTSSAKMSNPSNSSLSSSNVYQTSNGSSRNRFVIDGSAPLKLLDRKTLAETQYLESKGKARPTKGGLSINTANGVNHPNGAMDRSSNTNANASTAQPVSPLTPHPNGNPRKRSYRDELFEVVDPVSLLGPLGE